LKELIRKKDKGEKIEVSPAREEGNVIDLMDALRRSAKGARAASPRRKRTGKRTSRSAKKRSAPRHRKAS
jgi:DNA end-binding protein Ku